MDTGVAAREKQTLVNGWNQAIGIIEKLHTGLEFALAEIHETGRKHPGTFEQNLVKGKKFYEAEMACDLAKKYLAAVNGP